MEARGGYPFQPIGDDIDQEDQHLDAERKRRERPVAVLAEGDQAVGGGDVKENWRRRPRAARCGNSG
jgi:hypothetical protein